MVTKTYTVTMHCPSCEMLLEGLEELPGVKTIEADYRTQQLTATFDPAVVTESYLMEAIRKEGYEVSPSIA